MGHLLQLLIVFFGPLLGLVNLVALIYACADAKNYGISWLEYLVKGLWPYAAAILVLIFSAIGPRTAIANGIGLALLLLGLGLITTGMVASKHLIDTYRGHLGKPLRISTLIVGIPTVLFQLLTAVIVMEAVKTVGNLH